MTDRGRTARARLELLVRREGDEGFDVREVPSAPAFVQSRPQRIAPEDYELAEVSSRVGHHRRYILKNRRTDRFLLVSEAEKFLWEQMDGTTSLQEMATAYVLRYGEFNFDILPQLIRKLQHAQLLTLRPGSRLRRALGGTRRPAAKLVESGLRVLERVVIASREVQPFFERFYRLGGFLIFTPAAAVVCAALAVAGVAAGVHLWSLPEGVLGGLGARPVLALLAVKLVFLATLASHQVVHALALVHYRRRVREFGFTFLH
ncbi:MAG: hypothetical protein ACREJG_05545, partial [Candidatus Rokuibacteriota bacterium]